LNGICDCRLISREGIPDGSEVVNVLRHHVQDLRKIHECNECGVETLLLRRVGEVCSCQARVRR
jgi:hypothetical protein